MPPGAAGVAEAVVAVDPSLPRQLKLAFWWWLGETIAAASISDWRA
jgi:hypothetical protein